MRALLLVGIVASLAPIADSVAQSRLQITPEPPPVEPRSRLSVTPADPSSGETNQLPSGRLRIEPRAGNDLRPAPGPISVLGSPAAAPVSRLAIAPVVRTSLTSAAAPVSRADIEALPLSVASIEPLGGSAVAAAQLRSELGAVETDRGTLISLPGDVLFDFDEAIIRRDARTTLAKLAELIALSPATSVLIEGHTDAKGAEAYNLKLSERRAASVADYLADRHGIDLTRLQQQGRGETAPAAPNTTATGDDDPEGRQRNRRVEVVLSRP